MRLFLIILMLVVGQSVNAAVVVVHSSVVQSEITADQARDLLLGRTNTFENGQNVILVICMDEAADGSIKAITGRSANLLLRGWKRLVFSGSGAMPMQSSTVSDALALVARTPRAMVVLPEAKDVPSGCRVIKILDK